MGALEWSWKGLGDLRTFLGVSEGSEVGLGGGFGSPYGVCGSQCGSGVPLGFLWVPNLGLGFPWVPNLSLGSPYGVCRSQRGFGSLIWVWGPPGVPLGP